MWSLNRKQRHRVNRRKLKARLGEYAIVPEGRLNRDWVPYIPEKCLVVSQYIDDGLWIVETTDWLHELEKEKLLDDFDHLVTKYELKALCAS